MISDAQFFEWDAEIFELFRREPESRIRISISGAADPVIEVSADEADERRIERIVEKARFEAVMKDSVSFLFKTLGVGASELTSALIESAAGDTPKRGTDHPLPDRGGDGGIDSREDHQPKANDDDE